MALLIPAGALSGRLPAQSITLDLPWSGDKPVIPSGMGAISEFGHDALEVAKRHPNWPNLLRSSVFLDIRVQSMEDGWNQNPPTYHYDDDVREQGKDSRSTRGGYDEEDNLLVSTAVIRGDDRPCHTYLDSTGQHWGKLARHTDLSDPAISQPPNGFLLVTTYADCHGIPDMSQAPSSAVRYYSELRFEPAGRPLINQSRFAGGLLHWLPIEQR